MIKMVPIIVQTYTFGIYIGVRSYFKVVVGARFEVKVYMPRVGGAEEGVRLPTVQGGGGAPCPPFPMPMI